MKQWHFFDKVYRRWVVLMIGPIEDFKKELERIGYKEREHLNYDFNGMCMELTKDNNTSGNSACLIYMPKWDIETFVHELAHLIIFQFEEVGLDIERSTTEAFAFYFEFWFTEMRRIKSKHPKGRSPSEAKR